MRQAASRLLPMLTMHHGSTMCVSRQLPPRLQRWDHPRALHASSSSVVASASSRARLQKLNTFSTTAAAASASSEHSASEEEKPPPSMLRRLPRANVSDGPTYAIAIGAEREAHLRFLAFHGCGTRFTVLYREVAAAAPHLRDDDEEEDDDDDDDGEGGRRAFTSAAATDAAATASAGGGFEVGELESARKGKGNAVQAADGPWRVRLASGGDGDGDASSAAAAQENPPPPSPPPPPPPPRVVILDALDALTGEEMTRLALFDEDLGDQRLYQHHHTNAAGGAAAGGAAAGEKWSATKAAPRWPHKLLARLNATGGVSGEDAVVCVDGKYFVELIELSAFPTPVLFPHGAWRVRGLGPGLPDFHAAAEAARGVDAVTALRALADAAADTSATPSTSSSSASGDGDGDGDGGGGDTTPEPAGRLTGELPGRGRIQLGGSGGVAGVGLALEAVTRREVKVTFPEGPLGLGFAPLDWDWGRGAQVWEVDPGSNAEAAGVRPGMVFTSVVGWLAS